MTDDKVKRKPRMSPLVVAAGAIAIIAWFVLSPGERVVPVGAGADSMQRQIANLVVASGGTIAAPGCSMAGNKHLTVSCPVNGLVISTLRSVLEANGWTPAEAAPLTNPQTHLAFRSGSQYLTVDAHSGGMVATVSAMLR